MKSWTPRRPSPALEHRLFEQPSETGGPATTGRWHRVLLVPAACALLLLLQTPFTGPDRTLLGRASDGTNALSGPGRNLALARATPRLANSSLNHVHAEIFDSTNWTVDPSPMRALPVFLTLTNGLIR